MPIPKAYKPVKTYVPEDGPQNMFDILCGRKSIKILGLLGLCYVGMKAFGFYEKYQDFSVSKVIEDNFKFKVSSAPVASAAAPAPEPPQAANGSATAAPAAPGTTTTPKSDPVALKAGEGQKSPEAGAAGAAPVKEVFFDPLSVISDSEVKILSALAQRRTSIEKMEQELKQKESAIEVLEKKIAEKTLALETLQQNIHRMLETLDSQKTDKIKSLAKMYETMKPDEAAKIFNNLDEDTLVKILYNITPKKLGLILAKVQVGVAKRITELLSINDTPFDKESTAAPGTAGANAQTPGGAVAAPGVPPTAGAGTAAPNAAKAPAPSPAATPTPAATPAPPQPPKA
jgi:flagellar motility protein MotE (MotC chaperone)